MVVSGLYHAQDGEKRVLRGYDAEFKVPSVDRVMVVVAKKLLPVFLKKKDPAYTALYTHIIEEITCVGGVLDPNELNPNLQSKEQLKNYIKFHKLPVDANDYADLQLLRKHVRLAKDEPNVFEEAHKKYMQTKTEDNALFGLNKDLLEKGNVGVAVPVDQGGEGTPKVRDKEEKIAPSPKARPKRRARKKTVPKTTPEPTPDQAPMIDEETGEFK